MNDFTFQDAEVPEVLGEKVKDKLRQIKNTSSRFLSTRVVAAVLESNSSAQSSLSSSTSSNQSQAAEENAKVIVLCTGTKSHTFKPPNYAPEHVGDVSKDGGGKYLRDCHAEVLARRGLKSHLLTQVAKCCEGEKSIFKKDGKRFSLIPGVKFHLYISEAPCGDAKIHSNKKGGLLMNKISDGQPCHTSSEPSDRSRIMTCSDKLLLWNVLGVQGAAMMNLLTARIFFSSLVIGQKQVDLDDLYRAVGGRLINNDFKLIYPSLADQEPAVNKMLLGTHSLYPGRFQNGATKKINQINQPKLGLDELKKIQVLEKRKTEAKTEPVPVENQIPDILDFETLQRIQKLPKSKNTKSHEKPMSDLKIKEAISDLKVIETESSAIKKNRKCFNWISGLDEELEILYRGLKESEDENKDPSRLSKLAFKRDLVNLAQNKNNTNKQMNCTYRDVKNKAKEYQIEKKQLHKIFEKYQMGFWQKADNSVDMF